jgi:hypothetical protein
MQEGKLLFQVSTEMMKKQSAARFLWDSFSIEHPGTTCIQRVAGTIISSPDATTRMGIGIRLELLQLEHHENMFMACAFAFLDVEDDDITLVCQ